MGGRGEAAAQSLGREWGEGGVPAAGDPPALLGPATLGLVASSRGSRALFLSQFLCTKFLEPIKDVPLPLSNSCFEALVQENIRRLLHEPPLEEAE